MLSGWAKANAVPDNLYSNSDPAQDTYKQFGLRAVLTYSDGTTEYHYAPFEPDLSEWQFVSLALVPEQSSKTVSTIQVVCAYEGNANTAVFDNISLVRELAQTYRYDDDGNLVSVLTPDLSEDTNTYSGGNLIKTVTGGNLIKTVTGGSGTYEYTYDTANRLTQAKETNTGLTQTYTYSTMGNATATSLYSGSSKKISSSASYSADGNRLASITDSTGSKVSYAYSGGTSTMLGLPTTVTDAKGTAYNSAYDSFGRITGNSIAQTATLGYNYSNGNLSSVVRTDNASKSQTYAFTYDVYGNAKTVKLGSRTLASYDYAAKNGPLTVQKYGNGDTVTFTYDLQGRVKTATYADGRTVTYAYNADGQLSSATETGGTAPATYLYTYDTLGRLLSSDKLVSGASVLRTGQTYNSYNQLTKQIWQLGSTGYTQNYTYNADGSLRAVEMPTGQTVSYTYDALRRISAVSAGAASKNITYRDISSTQTATQVSSVSYPNLVTPLTFGYTYDANGNILTYADTGKATVSYTYDSQGQLLKAAGDKTYTYTYDTAGNILTASDGTTTHTYTYGDSTWRDLLTAYDGETITYDAIGNPTSYYNGTRWTFGWENGRQLISASGNGKTISYTYTADGQRVTKTVDGVKHTYYYASGKLLRETYGSNVLDFCYTPDGKPYSLTYNGTVYYYILNLQGDVERVINASGSVVAYYAYTPYGEIFYQSGTMADINPLRYRGYYYDTETGLYYVSSRYYDPAIGRWICSDVLASTGQGILGTNMFAYCRNNPVNRIDISGTTDVVATDLDGNPILDEEDIQGGGGGGSSSGNGNGGNGGSQAGNSNALAPYYPPNNGFNSTPSETVIESGNLIQRTGSPEGRFVAPAGTPTETLSLPYNQIGQTTTTYVVEQPIRVLSGTAAPWFGSMGGGTQYLLLDGSVSYLLANHMISLYGG